MKITLSTTNIHHRRILQSQKFGNLPFFIQECINSAGVMIGDPSNILTGFSHFIENWQQLSLHNKQFLIQELQNRNMQNTLKSKIEESLSMTETARDLLNEILEIEKNLP
ncbi:MAG: hypothetical protein SFU25_01265 [Candidatus Caenarcaniphilales bacterium]|nr:hypothetical protein [Candidatus Caenarcaniphilales bacterium]